jgi:hypothetical protein
MCVASETEENTLVDFGRLQEAIKLSHLSLHYSNTHPLCRQRHVAKTKSLLICLFRCEKVVLAYLPSSHYVIVGIDFSSSSFLFIFITL